VEEELREYNKNKAALKSAITANNFKLDDSYKNKIDITTLGMEQSVKAGMKLIKKNRTDEECDEQQVAVKKELK
jgi:hypothetical protein